MNPFFDLLDLLSQVHVAGSDLFKSSHVLLGPFVCFLCIGVRLVRHLEACYGLLEGLDYLIGPGCVLSFERLDDMPLSQDGSRVRDIGTTSPVGARPKRHNKSRWLEVLTGKAVAKLTIDDEANTGLSRRA